MKNTVNKKSDLQPLSLSEPEIEDYSGLNFYVERYGKKRKNIVDNVEIRAYRFFIYVLFFSGVLSLLIFGSFPTSIKIVILGVIVLLLCLLKVFVEYWFRRKRQRKYADYIALREDYLKFCDQITAIEQLDNLGQEIPNRSEFVETLTEGRNILINAFRAERILRDDPHNNLLPEILNSSIDELKSNIDEALKINEKAYDYGNNLKDTVQLYLSIQQELQKLHHKIPKIPSNLN